MKKDIYTFDCAYCDTEVNVNFTTVGPHPICRYCADKFLFDGHSCSPCQFKKVKEHMIEFHSSVELV